MEQKKSTRRRTISTALTMEEYSKIERQRKASTCRTVSDYLRRSLFNKPITTTYRNRSIDDLVEELGSLRHELNHLENTFSQSVKRLHTLSQIEEFRHWRTTYEIEKKTLFNKVDDIKNNILKLVEKW